MSESIDFPLPTGFVPNTRRTATNSHSGHNVTFGELNGYEVAIKPFIGADGRTVESRRTKAEHEKRMYEIVGKLGYLTLQPRQVLVEHNIAYLITNYVPNLQAGTSFDMTRSLDDSSRGKPVGGVVSEIMTVLGCLHVDGITHGDAKQRNFSWHRPSGSGPYVIDLEGAQKHRSKQTRGQEFFENLVRNDLRSITYNLGQNGLGAQLGEPTRNDIFSDLIIAPYSRSIQSSLAIPRSTIDSALASYQQGVSLYHKHGAMGVS